jgi:UDP-2,3-diacylglucosamine hydrolase
MHLQTISNTIPLGTISSFAVLSDLHLREPNEKNSQLAVDTLKSLTDMEAVILLGDVFDFIFIASPFFQKRWNNIIQSLEYLTKNGTLVVFIEGNHDFGFEHFFPKELAAVIPNHGDAIIELTHPILGRVSLRHGDDIVCPPNYLKFRALIKSKLFQSLARHIPGCVMQFIFSRWAKISRSRDEYRRLDPHFFQDCVQKALSKNPNPPQTLVLGHVHEHIDTVFQNTRCFAGPSWLQAPNLLRCAPDGHVERFFLGCKDVPLFPAGKTR